MRRGMMSPCMKQQAEKQVEEEYVRIRAAGCMFVDQTWLKMLSIAHYTGTVRNGGSGMYSNCTLDAFVS